MHYAVAYGHEGIQARRVRAEFSCNFFRKLGAVAIEDVIALPKVEIMYYRNALFSDVGGPQGRYLRILRSERDVFREVVEDVLLDKTAHVLLE